MKVSTKIIVGFLVLMLLAAIVLVNQHSVIQQMQEANRESETNVKSAATILELQNTADLLGDNALKYFAGLGAQYEKQILELREEFIQDLDRLDVTANSKQEKAELAKLREAFSVYWTVFNKLKEQKKTWDPEDFPGDLTLAVDHLKVQSKVMLAAGQAAITQRVRAANEAGAKAERLSWIAGALSLILGSIVAVVIVTSTNEPLRRLARGTRAIAKGQFWHRLPANGKNEFAELARDFNVMAERLGELDKMKKDFVSHVSHDLKAPLASIRQIMHLLLQGIPGELNEEQKSLIQLSYNSAERLAAMVGNLLDVSRMEAGAMEYRMGAYDIVPLIKGVADEFEVQARQKSIQFQIESFDSAMPVECDRERIVQVIGNLYENALKFSPAESRIVTRLYKTQNRDVQISVTDSGPGVPDEHKKRIFEKFHQVKHGKKLAGQGVGLGLAICKTIVEAHHGEIWVEDNPEGGSIFTFRLKSPVREEVLTCGQTA